MKVKLDGVAETLLITLRVRAYETKRTDSLLKDTYAVNILDRIDFEESPKNKISEGTQIGTIVRTQFLDKIVRDFAIKHPDGVIVNLGCGLDARYKRLNIAHIQWFDIDIEETMNVRRQFFTDEANYKMITKSMLDESWMNEVPDNKPTLILLEGIVMYFPEEDLKRLFTSIFNHFDEVELAFDVLSASAAQSSDTHPDVKKYNTEFKWGLNNADDLKDWDSRIRIISDESYMVTRHLKRWPHMLRLLRWLPAIKNRCRVEHIGYNKAV